MSNKSFWTCLDWQALFTKQRTNRKPLDWRTRLNVELLEDRRLLAVLTVDTRLDIVDAADQFTSLREAISAANDEVANPGRDTINFDADLSYSTMLLGIEGFDENGAIPSTTGSGELVITSDVTITAGDATLVRFGRELGSEGFLESERLDHRVLRIDSGVVQLTNLIIQRGQTTEGEYGAGIWNAGTLTLTNSIVGDNVQLADTSHELPILGGGGGIFNAPSATLSLNNTVVGSIELDPDALLSLGIDPDDFPTGENGQPLLIPGNVAEGLGGGIFNEGTVSITEGSAISFNRVMETGDNVNQGGGIFNAGSLDVVDSQIANNAAPLDTGIFGGGIHSSTMIPRGDVDMDVEYDFDVAPGPVTVSINNSTIEGNRAGNGGGIYVGANTDLLVTDSTLSQNTADTGPLGDGGAIDNDGIAVVVGSTIMNNVAEQNGGGIHSTNRLILRSATVSSNGVFGNVTTNTGGGVYVAGGTASVNNSTIAFNAATGRGGGVRNLDTSVFDNSIVANNIAGSANPDGYNTASVTAARSLIGNNAGSFFADEEGNLLNVDPLLGPLGDHGGPTLTHGLLAGSPAIDSSYTQEEIDSIDGFPPTDQRGQPRLVGPAVDRGAFESQPPATMRVDSLEDVVNGYYGPGDFTLREAVLWAKQIPGADAIGFSRDLVRLLENQPEQDPLVLELTEGQIVIDSDLTIRGPGADILSISGGFNSRIFFIDEDVTVEISGLTLTDGNAVGISGVGGGNGGAILNSGSLVLRDAVVSNSIALSGGGIDNVGSGSLALDTVHVWANSAMNGAGGGLYNLGTASVVNSTFSENTTSTSGGAIIASNHSPIEIVNSTISTNRANSAGGGIFFDPQVTGLLTNVTITNNFANESENANSTTNGGGIWKSSDADVTLHNSIVWENFSHRAIHDLAGTYNQSSSYNLIGVGGDLIDGVNDNQVGVTNALLGPLRSAGGMTPVHALRPGSPAIDAADPNFFLRTDQRGQPRPVDDPNTEFLSHPPIVKLTDAFSVTTNVSSSFPAFGPERALDGDLQTSWFTDGGDAANLGTTPFFEVVFPEDVTVTQLNIRGNREFPNNFEIFQGRYDLYDEADGLLYSEVADLPVPFRDLDLAIPEQTDVRRVRFTLTQDESSSPGFSELEILGPLDTPIPLGPGDIGAYEYVPPELPSPIVVDTLSGVSDGIYGPGQVSLGDAIAFANASPTHNEIEFAEGLFLGNDDAPLDEAAIVNLVQALPVTAAASSFSVGNEPDSAIDGDLDSSWFTASGDAANLGKSPWFEVDFGQEVTVTHITMRSTRSNPTGLDFIEGRFDVFDEAGVVLYSTDVTLPELLLPPAERDLQLDIPDQTDARRVRFTSLDDEGNTPGFAELEVFGTSGLIGLNGEQLVITDDLTITGPGAELLSISGNRRNRILRILDDGGGTPNVTISGVTLTNGRIPFGFGENAGGGAIWNSGDLTLQDVYVANNSIDEYRYESADGGGIYNDGTLHLENTTVALNSAVDDGGGIYNAGTLTLLNSTISTNVAAPAPGDSTPNAEGGGLYNAAGATATLSYSTITLNRAVRTNGLGSGVYNAGTLMIGNTVVAENGEAPFYGDDGWTTGGGVSTSLGHNLIGSNDGNFALTPADGDQFGSAANRLDPFLTDLISIGGSVPMHGALPSSPVVDAANPADFPATDQRGMARPVDDVPDIGAFELEDYTWGSQLVVDSFSDALDADYSAGSLTLREAILWANAKDGTEVVDGIDRIMFCPVMVQMLVDGEFGTNTLVLNGKQLVITDDLEIFDPGTLLEDDVVGAEIFRISADNKSRVLTVELGATVAIAGLTFAEGNPPASDSERRGGAILNQGNLSLSHVVVENSTAQSEGGGIYNDTGILAIDHSTIRGNQTVGVGGGGGISNESGELHIHASTIADNQAGDAASNGGGGGIFHSGTVATISASVIYDNRSQSNGGGILVLGAQASMAMINTTISGNRTLMAFNAGGGGIIGSGGATIDLLNVTVTENIANTSGGGIRLSGSTMHIGNSIVANNDVPGGSGNTDEIDASEMSTVVSLGHNLFGLSIVGVPAHDPPDVITNMPELGPLADNGGPTKTHLLKATSPAIDAADAMLGLAAFPMRIMDQRGRPLVDIADDKLTTDGDFDIPDIGAYEVQGVGISSWDYDALDQSQFGPGPALVYGFGFDEGVPNSSINPDPYFLGFQFDTGPQKAGEIVEGLFGTKFGGELAWDFSGKLGFDLGFYVNSGSVDVNYDGNVNYVIDSYPSGEKAAISTFVDVDDGSLFTVSPKVGAYADLVIELNADVSATGCLFGCIGIDLLNIHFAHTEELIAVNRQVMDDSGRPMFFDLDGNAFARNSATGNFHYPDYSDPSDPNNGKQVSPALQQQLVENGVLPIFDGEIRTFSLGLDEIANGIEESINLKKRVEALKAAKDLYGANSGVTKASNRLEQRERELADLMDKRDNASTAAEVVNANREIEQLQGKNGDGGELKESREALASAKEKQQKAVNKFAKKAGKAAQTVKSVKSGVGVSVSEAEGSLLGAQVDLELGFGINGADIARKLGSVQVTLPDVNLVDPTADDMGALHATTADFPKQSDLDFKRQLASASVDLATFLPFPTGKYELNLGPLSLGVTTVSYNIGPQLNVTQDVSAMPVAQELTYDFFRHGLPTAAEVFVTIDGMMQTDTVPGPDGNVNTLSSVRFAPGSRVMVETAGTPLAGQPIDVTPTLAMDARFTNDIGLDIDLEGVFEAFALRLSAFGFNIIDLGPLIKHKHTISTFDLGSVFTRTFDLDQQSTTLDTFTLFDQVMDGRTAATAFMTEPATSNVSSVDIAAASIEPGRPVFVRSDLINPDVPDELYTVLDVAITGADVDNLYVLDESLTVTPGEVPGTFQISGFNQQMLSERSSALFALAFAESADATVTATRSMPMSLTMPPDTTGNTGGVTGDGFEEVGSTAVFNNDVDGDGVASPLTDGVLMIRYLDGLRGNDLVAGAVSPNATRADPGEIADYIDNVLEKIIRYHDPDTGEVSLRNTLDFDGNSIVPTAAGDGILLARYLAGFRDGALINGVSAADGADVVQFIETGRTSADDVRLDEFGKIIDRGGSDLLGLDGALDADRSDGSSASAAANPMGSAVGASPEFAVSATSLGGTGSGVATYDFELDQYGNSVMFREIYLDGELISRVADGSPIDFGTGTYAELINTGADPEMFTSQMGNAILGTEEPIFVRAPDAVGFQYEALDGYGFESFVIDPQVGGNLLLPSEFDLYLFNESSGQWEFVTQITGENPEQVGVNGFLFHEFTDGPVTRFRLYSSSLPNEELHDAENSDPPELFTTTGFLFAEPGGGATTPPTVRMTPLAERQLFFIPDQVTIETPVFESDMDQVTTDFRLVRSGANVVPLIDGEEGTPIPMATVLELRVTGHDNVEDTLTLESSGGPLRMPLVYNGGFRHDTLIIDQVNGSGLTIDLVDHDSLLEVEVVDIRGSGDNELILDHAAVVANDPFTQTLQVRGNAGDTISIDAGWTPDGTVMVDDVEYDRYFQGDATLLVESAADVFVRPEAADATGTTSTPRAANDGSNEYRSNDSSPTGFGPIVLTDSPRGASQATSAGSAIGSGQGAGEGAVQMISARKSLPAVIPGVPISVSVDYRTVSSTTIDTPGLHLRMHFDSTKLSLAELTDMLPTSFSIGDVQSEPEVGDLDRDPSTDSYVNLLWLDATGNWPGGTSAQLFTAVFEVVEPFVGSTTINFTGSPAAGFTLVAPSIVIGELPGDYNRDLVVDDADYRVWRNTFGTSVPPATAADGNADGVVNAADFVVWRNNMGLTLFAAGGDYDDSGFVDQADYDLWRQTFGSTTNLAADGNSDGIVNAADFILWRNNEGRMSTAALRQTINQPINNDLEYVGGSSSESISFSEENDRGRLVGDVTVSTVTHQSDSQLFVEIGPSNRLAVAAKPPMNSIAPSALATVFESYGGPMLWLDDYVRFPFYRIERQPRLQTREFRSSDLALLNALDVSIQSLRWHDDEVSEAYRRVERAENARNWLYSVDEALSAEIAGPLVPSDW